MNDHLLFLSSLLQVGTGRRVSLYNRLAPMLESRGLGRIASYVDRARQHDRQTEALEARWNAQRYSGKHNVELAELDPVADRLISATHALASAQIAGLSESDPLTIRVTEMLDDVLPGGVLAITSLPYVDQAMRLDECVAKLGAEYAPLVRELGMTALVGRLTAIASQYRDAVDAGPGRISFAEVDAMRARGHLYLVEISAMIGGHFHDSDDPDQVRERDELLAPIREVQVATSNEHRLRRARGAAEVDEPEDAPDDDDQDTGGPAIPGTSADTSATA